MTDTGDRATTGPTPSPDQARRRAAYAAILAGAGQAPSPDRPLLPSPAAAAQAPHVAGGTYFAWTPTMLPWEFSTWVQESRAHTDTCFLGDWSGLSTLELHGPQALDFLRSISASDLTSVAVGALKHVIQCTEDGLVAGEGILCRTAPDTFTYQGGGTDWTAWQLSLGSWDVAATDLTPDMFLFHLQGPTSLAVLEAATETGFRDLRFHDSRLAQLAARPVRVLRAGVSGELGYEVHGRAEDGSAVWSALAEAGTAHGLRQLGVRSMLVAHIESGIPTVGLDYLPASIVTPGAPRLAPQAGLSGSFVPANGPADLFRYPGELGWVRSVHLDHEFLGRDALRRQADEGGPARTLVGLRWDADDVRALLAAPLSGDLETEPMELPRRVSLSYDQVLYDGSPAGVSSGRTFSPHLAQTISLGVLNRQHTAPGTEVTVLWGTPGTAQRELRATVVKAPFKPRRQHTDTTA